nr:hypothetical protein [Corynebacterium sp. UBA4397]
MADHAHNLRASAGAGRPFGVITRGCVGAWRVNCLAKSGYPSTQFAIGSAITRSP